LRHRWAGGEYWQNAAESKKHGHLGMLLDRDRMHWENVNKKILAV
jgi:hypothetical protein